jgi:hypothetical protein
VGRDGSRQDGGRIDAETARLFRGSSSHISESAAEALDMVDLPIRGAVHIGRLLNKGYRESRVVGSPSSIHVRRTSAFVTAAFARAVASPIVIGVPLKIIRYAC